ncbi:phosphoesterase [Flavobacteriaceae bacterium F08102]|nr:phosphoesterase [Flavobacteriaceae bacterium F08102]
MPGNHDWYTDGLHGLKREQNYIEQFLGEDSFLPKNGCPLESIAIGEHIQLILVDTEWYLEDWNKHPTINEDCAIKTRARFLEEINAELSRNQHKTIVFAMHHPMYTNGIHGGQYRLSKHFKPSERLIPLPILGSLVTQIRTQGGISIQDRYNVRYNGLMKRLETMVKHYERLVFVSGHDHSLQYIVNGQIKQIISGSGSKSTFASLTNDGLFSYGKQGFARLVVFKDGSAWVQFFGEDRGEPKRLFQKEVFQKPKSYPIETLPDYFESSRHIAVYSKQETEKIPFFESDWGRYYSDVYTTPIAVPVVVLDTLKGGLQVIRKDVEHARKSLLLQTKDGQELSMTALRKTLSPWLRAIHNQKTFIEEPFKQTLVSDLCVDYYEATHPYAFLAIPVLSAAADLYYPTPSLYFIPKHKALGNFNSAFGGELYTLTERPEGENTYAIISSIRKNEKHKIDEAAYIRARLFDLLIGNWNGQQDSWRWTHTEQPNGDVLYVPLPKDRNYIFSNFNGASLEVMKLICSSTKQFHVYDSIIKDFKWMHNQGIELDRVLLQTSDSSEWITQATYLQEHITDAVISQAFQRVPSQVQDSTLDEIKVNLKRRRQQLVSFAKRYAAYLHRLAIVMATDQDDYIQVERFEKGVTEVKISSILNGKPGVELVNRKLYHPQTKEIWIYGLAGQDVFDLKGKVTNATKVRIVGGQNNDTYTVENGANVRIYDHKTKKNTIRKNNGANVYFSDNYEVNLFDYTHTISYVDIGSTRFGYTPDDGLIVGGRYSHTYHGFSLNPFTWQHRFSGNYYTAFQGVDLQYEGEFNLRGRWNLELGVRFNSTNYGANFFGFGNETINEDDQLGLAYNRIRKGLYGASLGLVKNSPAGSEFRVKTMVEGIAIGYADGSFLADVAPNPAARSEDRRHYGTVKGGYRYKSLDRPLVPTRGMVFSVETGLTSELNTLSKTFAFLNANLGFYNSLSRNRQLTLKSNVSTNLRFSNDIPFYYAANLGGETGLRGYHSNRFTGHNLLVGNLDIRYRFNRFRTPFAPIQMGVFTGTDLGRVWVNNGDYSRKWHPDYGGGFWITAANFMTGTWNVFTGTEGVRFSFGLEVNF